eukprot:EG_transcript_7691
MAAVVSDNTIATGRVKSFSQKSGWGFIQLFENGEEDAEGSKDVFFHRADVSRSGTCELRPGILVHCRVVSTGKGEKASDIKIIEESGSETQSETLSVMTCMTCVGSSEDSLSHCPYESEITTIPSPKAAPPPHRGASYSLRTSENYVSWQCTSCSTHNASRSIRRVVVVCASCGLGHQVQHWICICEHANRHTSRHCGRCDVPYSMACQQLSVLAAQPPSIEQTEAAPAARKPQRIRSQWQHGEDGWSHTMVDAPAASIWCQDATQHPMHCGRDVCQDALVEKCKPRLLWAFAQLTEDASSYNSAFNVDWLKRLAVEVVKPQHQLFCHRQPNGAFVPNPCADTENPQVLQMYEVVGMLLALAVATGQPLQPCFPMWMARTLLGFPTTLEDLNEYNPQLWHKADASPSATEEITQFGVTRTFEFPRHMEANNQRAYGLWLKDLYLAKSIDIQLKQVKHGFFYALMGDHVLQALTPVDCYKLLNGQ